MSTGRTGQTLVVWDPSSDSERRLVLPDLPILDAPTGPTPPTASDMEPTRPSARRDSPAVPSLTAPGELAQGPFTTSDHVELHELPLPKDVGIKSTAGYLLVSRSAKRVSACVHLKLFGYLCLKAMLDKLVQNKTKFMRTQMLELLAVTKGELEYYICGTRAASGSAKVNFALRSGSCGAGKIMSLVRGDLKKQGLDSLIPKGFRGGYYFNTSPANVSFHRVQYSHHELETPAIFAKTGT